MTKHIGFGYPATGTTVRSRVGGEIDSKPTSIAPSRNQSPQLRAGAAESANAAHHQGTSAAAVVRGCQLCSNSSQRGGRRSRSRRGSGSRQRSKTFASSCASYETESSVESEEATRPVNEHSAEKAIQRHKDRTSGPSLENLVKHCREMLGTILPDGISAASNMVFWFLQL